MVDSNNPDWEKWQAAWYRAVDEMQSPPDARLLYVHVDLPEYRIVYNSTPDSSNQCWVIQHLTEFGWANTIHRAKTSDGILEQAYAIYQSVCADRRKVLGQYPVKTDFADTDVQYGQW